MIPMHQRKAWSASSWLEPKAKPYRTGPIVHHPKGNSYIFSIPNGKTQNCIEMDNHISVQKLHMKDGQKVEMARAGKHVRSARS